MCIRDRRGVGRPRPALIFAYLRPEQTILGLILEDDDDDEYPIILGRCSADRQWTNALGLAQSFLPTHDDSIHLQI